HYHKTGEIYRPEDGQEWSKGTVAKMLINETYTGTLIQGKRRQSLVKGESQHSTSPEDWIVAKNAHEAIIPNDEFQQIQQLRRERKENHYFSSERNDLVRDYENRYLGLVFLKDTERPLYRRTRIYGKAEKRLLYCFQADNHTGKSQEKVNIFITEENLDAMVLQTIQGIASQLISQKSFLEKIKNEYLKRKEIGELELKELAVKKDLSEAAIARLYERYATGSLDKVKYIMLKEEESRKHASYSSEISRLEMLISKLKKDERKSRKVARTIFQARKQTKLSGEVIKELIERIDVISKTEIEVHFLYDFSENGGI
ncbi:MAG: recombinase family protein, partial [Lachnospiraceae bacterium]